MTYCYSSTTYDYIRLLDLVIWTYFFSHHHFYSFRRYTSAHLTHIAPGLCSLFLYSFHVHFSFSTIHDMPPLTDGQTLPHISITIRACYPIHSLRRTDQLF